MKRKLKIPKYLVFFLISYFFVFIVRTGVLSEYNQKLSDSLYQRQIATENNIIIIAIDEKTLQQYGQYQDWNREKIADIISLLNKSDNCKPAAIAIDVLHSSTTNDKTDKKLVDSIGNYNNVITASVASYESDFYENKNSFKYDDFHITSYEEPFESLKKATIQGHINAMLDDDGILRHHLLKITLDDGTTIPSMALKAAKLYDEYVQIPKTNENGFWYLAYSKNPGNFEAISMVDVLEGNIQPEYFNNKIVLIGPMAIGLQDSYFASIEPNEQMYGVEYQANAINALLTGNFKNEVNRNTQRVFLFIITFIFCILFYKFNVKKSTVICIISTCSYILLCVLFYNLGLILEVMYVPLIITMIYIACVAIHAIKENQKRKHITNTFERYVAPEIVNELLKSDDEALKLGGKACRIAVLFVDIRGFTTMSEKLSPETVVKILNEYLTLISDCIFKYNGTLDKFVGDAVMAFWNAPLPQDDYVMNSVKAALDMALEAQRLSAKLEIQYGQCVKFGIGVHVGDAVVGNIGSIKRMDYTAIGDTVNTAARLEANAPGNTIYISEDIVEELGNRIKASVLENPPKLKGKSKDFKIYSLEKILDNGYCS